jgi:hypothetical protein
LNALIVLLISHCTSIGGKWIRRVVLLLSALDS